MTSATRVRTPAVLITPPLPLRRGVALLRPAIVLGLRNTIYLDLVRLVVLEGRGMPCPAHMLGAPGAIRRVLAASRYIGFESKEQLEGILVANRRLTRTPRTQKPGQRLPRLFFRSYRRTGTLYRASDRKWVSRRLPGINPSPTKQHYDNDPDNQLRPGRNQRVLGRRGGQRKRIVTSRFFTFTDHPPNSYPDRPCGT